MAPSDIGGESVPSGLPEPSASKMLSTLPEQIPARPLYVNSLSQFFGNLAVFKCFGIIEYRPRSSVFPPLINWIYISQEFRTLLEDKSTDNSFLAFCKQNYLFEQGTSAAVVKGRLRAHYFGRMLGHLLR